VETYRDKGREREAPLPSFSLCQLVELLKKKEKKSIGERGLVGRKRRVACAFLLCINANTLDAN
jgi:hypothetical protein